MNKAATIKTQPKLTTSDLYSEETFAGNFD